MPRGDDPPLQVEPEHVHTPTGLDGWCSQDGCHTAVSQLLGGIPDHLIAWKPALLLFKLGRMDLDLPQAEDIGLLRPDPIE